MSVFYKNIVYFCARIQITDMKTILLFLLELLICMAASAVSAQTAGEEDVTVSGRVTSSEDGVPLAGVVVMSSVGGWYKCLR